MMGKLMGIKRFEDIETWQLAGELRRKGHAPNKIGASYGMKVSIG
jgi:hypothetical protein